MYLSGEREQLNQAFLSNLFPIENSVSTPLSLNLQLKPGLFLHISASSGDRQSPPDVNTP